DRGGDIAKLITATLAQAGREHVSGAQTDLLNERGQLFAERGDVTGAETAFSQAAGRAQSAGPPREEAAEYLHLLQLYRTTNQLPKASAAIDHGIQALQRVEEGYDLPLSSLRRPKCSRRWDRRKRPMPRSSAPLISLRGFSSTHPLHK